MAAREWLIEGLDSLFFRGGQPFNAGESGYLRSLFPPTPETIQGFVRALILRENDYPYGALTASTGYGELQAQLGGRKGVGALRLGGPYLEQNGERLYPAPLHLGTREGSPCLLRPGEKTACDLGEEAQLPALSGDGGGFKSSGGQWITARGLAQVLGGVVPKETELRTLRRPDRLFLRKDGQGSGTAGPEPCLTPEPRAGIALDADRRAAREGMLYAIESLRPAVLHEEPGWEVRPLRVGVVVDGIEEPLQLADGRYPATFGGEGRLVELGVRRSPAPLPAAAPIAADGTFCLALLTPADFKGSWLPPGFQGPGAKGTLNGIEITIVTACVERAVRIGGWQMAPDGNGGHPSKPARGCVPAGSVYFCKATAGQAEIEAAFHGRHVGGNEEKGYGWCVVGAWPQGEGGP